MSDVLTVSVVIVSRHRPDALRRCLVALSQLDYRPFEVVVVADPASCADLRSLPQAVYAKLIRFDEANISLARNTGIAAAAGDVVAFIDDDAVPEPSWLRFLVAPFAAADVAATGGFVLGRNGISIQSGARWVDRCGEHGPIAMTGTKAVVLTPTAQKAIRTEGTNMALRRSVLAGLGGFDPNYHYFLDETDLNLRLAERGLKTAIVPLAQVHHGFAANAMRRADRVPWTLFEIGASWAVFLRKHCEGSQRAPAWLHILAQERRRALAHMVTGGLEPRAVRRLMQSLTDGWQAGTRRTITRLPPMPAPTVDFSPYVTGPPMRTRFLAGRVWSKGNLRMRALATNRPVTVIRLSPTALFHKVRYNTDGYWEQTGGLFGKSDRTQPLFRWMRFGRRVRAEIDRVAVVRNLQG